MRFKELPVTIKELFQVATGFYLVLAATAIFCNWSTPSRVGVIVFLAAVFVVVLILEAIAALLLLWVIRLTGRSPVKDGSSSE